MKTEIKEKWVNALRSGDYEQGVGALRRDDKYCCLGVLTDLFIKEHPNIAKWEDEGPNIRIEDDLRRPGWLIPEVVNWAGFKQEANAGRLDPRIDDGDTLSFLNDGKGYDFQKIADVIERNADEL